MVIDFNYNIHQLSHTSAKDFQYLKLDITIRKLLSDNPLHAKRQPPTNLFRFSTSSNIFNTSPHQGNITYNKPRCLVWKHIISHNIVPHVVFKSPALRSDSSKLVYLLSVTNAITGISWEKPFHLRFNNHKNFFFFLNQGQQQELHVSADFNRPGHSMDNVGYVLLASCFGSRKERCTSRLTYSVKVNSHIEGLNIDFGLLWE